MGWKTVKKVNSSKELDRAGVARGDRVLFDKLPYQARWSTTGDAPSTEYPIGPDDPWQPLFTVPGEPVTN